MTFTRSLNQAFGASTTSNTTVTASFTSNVAAGSLIVLGWSANTTSLTATVADNSSQSGSANVYTATPVRVTSTMNGGGAYCKVTRPILSSDVITVTLSASATRKGLTSQVWNMTNGNPVLNTTAALVDSDTSSPVGASSSTGTLADAHSMCVKLSYWIGGAVGAGWAHSTPASGWTSATGGISGGTTTRVECNIAFVDDVGATTSFTASDTYTSITGGALQVLTFTDLVPASSNYKEIYTHNKSVSFA